MKLKFKGRGGWRGVQNNIESVKDALNAIDIDLKVNYPYFRSYYKRMWMDDNKLKFDVGDYSCFYYLELEEGETWEGKVQESLLR